jgi:hypothetical protein
MIPFTSVIRSGSIEPLILFADSANTFDKEVFSPLYPKDIIYYDINDNSCEDGTWNTALQRYEGGTTRTGKIYYRKDTINGLECHYDWRNVKFRRWAVDAQLWVSGGSYTKYDVAKSLSDGNIYVCKIDTSGVTNPMTDTTNWQLWLNISTVTSFWSWTPTKSEFNVGNITTTNLIINNVTPGTDYNDYYTFCIYDELDNSSGIINGTGSGIIGVGFKKFEIENINHDLLNYNDGYNINYNNIVFFLIPDGDVENYCYCNSFEENCFNNTIIGNGFVSNTIGNYFSINTIGNDFRINTIGNNFNSNTIGNSFYFNTIGNNFISNTIGNSFYSNTIGNSFNFNTIGNSFYYNTIGNNFNSNTIGNNFNFNTIENDFNSNTIGNSFYSNTIGNYFKGYNNTYNNIIGDNFQHNTVESFDSTVTLNTKWTIGNNFQNNYVKANSIPDNTDFTSGSHVYQSYDCEIFKRQDGTPLLKYMDNTNTYQFVSITS